MEFEIKDTPLEEPSLAFVDLSVVELDKGTASEQENHYSIDKNFITITKREVKVEQTTYNIDNLIEDRKRLQEELDTFVSLKQKEIDFIDGILEQYNTK